jgi:hypothetical protein
MHAILAAEIPWARTLIGRLGRGVYEVGKDTAVAQPGAGRRRRTKTS